VIAYSVLIGGLIYIIPNMYFAFYAFRYRGAQAAQYVLMSFYRGEIGKFLLSSVGFAITFTLVQPLNLISVFSAYIALTIFQCVRLQSLTKD
jgi:ATP synthase protein I